MLAFLLLACASPSTTDTSAPDVGDTAADAVTDTSDTRDTSDTADTADTGTCGGVEMPAAVYATPAGGDTYVPVLAGCATNVHVKASSGLTVTAPEALAAGDYVVVHLDDSTPRSAWIEVVSAESAVQVTVYVQ